jgi:hypothetical protein
LRDELKKKIAKNKLKTGDLSWRGKLCLGE